jgi:rod shape-determining protein MreB
MGLFNFFSNDVAIDLGTANTLIWMKGKDIVLDEPSIVAFDRTTKHIIAIGHEAKAMIGKTHRDIKIIRPLRDGAIADFEITEGMLRAFIRKVSMSWQPARRVVVCVPSGITEVEKRAVRDSCEHAGAKEVYLIAEPMASAIGIGLNVHDPVGNLIVDIGGGTTEIAVIALAGIVSDESIRTAGDEMTESIIQYFRSVNNLRIGDKTAEMLKMQVGSAVPLEEELYIEVKGQDLVHGIPKMIQVSSADIREALAKPINEIVQAVLRLLERTPPELASDIFDRGIMLTGGGALLKGLDERLRIETSLPVHVAEDPLLAVVKGTGIVLENLSDFTNVIIKSSRF